MPEGPSLTRDKVFSGSAAAVSGIPDGATILLGGFGGVGVPENLLVAMADHPARELTIVTNHAGFGEHGLAVLLQQGKVRKLICTYAFHRSAFVFRELYMAGKIELEQIPQGTMAERIRAAGAGIPAFFTPTGVGTQAAEGKESRSFGGRETLLERALPGDVAIIKAHKADRLGNLVYRGTAANFNPVMAAAAPLTIAEVEAVVEPGEIAPETVHTPSIYVNRVVLGEDLELRSET
ncbi:MAG: 3-oxoacid CoA-transferase subunit A [Nitrospinota bacterium]|nr:3-oxoacid CoA-transferase subunit A [Nitrospinota bacterium]